MGGKLVSGLSPLDGGKSDNDLAPVSYTETFYKHLPFYLHIGMTYDQYFNEDCCLVKYYREAYEMGQKVKNQELWLQGRYIYEALCDVSPVLHAFAKNGTKPLPYLEEPLPLSLEEVRERKEREEKERYDKQKAKIESMIKQINKRFENEGG